MIESGTEKILKESMGLKKDETLLIITDPKMYPIASKMYQISQKFSDEPILILMKEREHNGEEPPKPVSVALENSDVSLLATTKSLTHTEARRRASERGTRIASMPGVTEEMFSTGLQVDYQKMSREIDDLLKILKGSKSVRIVAPNGTSISFSIQDRVWYTDKGIYRNPGDFGNLPAGEVFIAPVEGSANGTLVFEGFDDYGDVRLEVRNGFVTEISGSEKLEEDLERIENSRNIAEFGIGMNPNAILTGKTLQDEKVKGTIHIALGSNIFFGGTTKSSFHMDGIIKEPTVYIDNTKLMENGKFPHQQE
ncbi:MAG: aminopeptidase [Candidatus Aenigmatarchaeota archaeon]|nr:MAG: aminopeptidase [Candidatus Aenigmarchaeota archaeon]